MSTYTTVSAFTRTFGPGEPERWFLHYRPQTATQYIIVPSAVEGDFQVGDYLTIAANTASGPGSGSIATVQAEVTAVGDAGTLLSGAAGWTFAAFTVPQGFDVDNYSMPMSIIMGNMAYTNRTSIADEPVGVATFERLSSGGGGEEGNPLPTYGTPTFVDRVWGNLPMQPNTERSEVAEELVIVAPNANQNFGWSGYSVYPSGQLDPALGDHVVAVTGYNGFPEFGAAGGATGPTGPTGAAGLVIPFTSTGGSTNPEVTFTDEYGNPTGEFWISGQGGSSESPVRSFFVLEFAVPNAQVTASPTLTALKTAAEALSASNFNMDWYSGVPNHVQQDAWVRSTVGASLRHFEFNSLVSANNYGSWPEFYSIQGNNENGFFFSTSSGAIRTTLDTSDTGVFFAKNDWMMGPKPISFSNTMYGTTRFTIYLLIDTTAEYGRVEDNYGNPVTDQYGNPVIIDGANYDQILASANNLWSTTQRPRTGTLTIKA